ERVVLKDKLGDALDRLAELAAEHNVAILASGDPLFFGVGALVVKKIGAAHVEILPAPSSVQLAFARVGVKWDDAAVVSLPGRAPPAISFLHEDDFAKRMPKKGLITKREARLVSLAMLQLRPSSVVWDVGAGSGSVAIEASMLAYEGSVFAVEVDPEGVEICRENVRAHAVDNVRIVAGRAPEALAELPDPDAVFVGGSKGSMAEIVAGARARLRSGGR